MGLTLQYYQSKATCQRHGILPTRTFLTAALHEALVWHVFSLQLGRSFWGICAGLHRLSASPTISEQVEVSLQSPWKLFQHRAQSFTDDHYASSHILSPLHIVHLYRGHHRGACSTIWFRRCGGIVFAPAESHLRRRAATARAPSPLCAIRTFPRY